MVEERGRHYIGGAWLGDAPHGLMLVENPSDGVVFAQAPYGSAELASQAVLAARHAFESTQWASNPRLRATALLTFADELEHRADEIAELLSRESGIGHLHGTEAMNDFLEIKHIYYESGE